MALSYSVDTEVQDGYSVVKVPVQRIKSLWDHAFTHLMVGMSVAPELRIEDVVDGLFDESIQLWIVTDGHEIVAAFLTSIENDRGDWVVSLYALGGSQARYWLGLCDQMMEAFGRHEGAKRIRMCGRKAWQRLLPDNFAITGTRCGHFIYERPI
jgi:hypothetical protein